MTTNVSGGYCHLCKQERKRDMISVSKANNYTMLATVLTSVLLRYGHFYVFGGNPLNYIPLIIKGFVCIL